MPPSSISQSTDAPIQAQPFKPSDVDENKGNWFQNNRTLVLLASLGLVIVWFIWFIFSAKSVRMVLTPANANLSIDGGFNVNLGGVYLLREGNYQIVAQAPGYYELEMPLTVNSERNQKFELALEKLPGLVTFSSTPTGAQVQVDDTPVGTTPLQDLEIPAGEHQVRFLHERYQTSQQILSVEGRKIRQQLNVDLLPDWAVVSINSSPAGAAILIEPLDSDRSSVHLNRESEQVASEPNSTPPATTPGRVEILSGEHRIKLKLQGYKTWQRSITITASKDVQLPTVILEKADGLVNISSRPGNASVTVNGKYQGDTPLELNLKPNNQYDLRLFKPGYQVSSRAVRVIWGEEQNLNISLKPLVGEVEIQVLPADAELYVDGKKQTAGNTRLTLSAVPHTLELKKSGYAGYSTRLTPQPGFTQEVKVKLLTLAEARLASLVPKIKSAGGQTLLLFSPDSFTMGASRREPGRRANETLREVELTRLFYLSEKEVTNAEFRQFASGHSSGEFETHDLNKPKQPVVNVTWQEAALYCNWLSERDKLQAFYQVEFGAVTGTRPNAKGYRLPTEAEWAWSARSMEGTDRSRRFSWGEKLPPPSRHGNYADMAAAHLVGRIIFGYNDNYIVSAPVSTFAPNNKALYDLGGNVAEWINDYYEIPGQEKTTDPMGPTQGEYHVIRGSSWMHGTITDLRLSFRDYGRDGRQDLGFRIARFAE